MKRYITYYRVSSKQQGTSGLGLDAQKSAVENFLKSRDAEQIDSFTEVESGTNGNRPVLKEAIEMCKDEGATLLIARLDRLSRNAAFLFNLRDELEEAGTSFVALDLPDIKNTMMLGVLAAGAQQYSEYISKRTKEGLAEAKARGTELGSPENLTDEAREKAWASTSRKARKDPDTRKAFHFIQPRREKGLSYQAIADQLNAEGYRTRRGKKFYPAQVRKIYLRFTETDNQPEPKRDNQ